MLTVSSLWDSSGRGGSSYHRLLRVRVPVQLSWIFRDGDSQQVVNMSSKDSMISLTQMTDNEWLSPQPKYASFQYDFILTSRKTSQFFLDSLRSLKIQPAIEDLGSIEQLSYSG